MPIIEYLGRGDALGLLYIELKPLERFFLEELLQQQLDAIGSGIGNFVRVEIMIDRGTCFFTRCKQEIH